MCDNGSQHKQPLTSLIKDGWVKNLENSEFTNI